MQLRRRGLPKPTLDAMRSSASLNLGNSAQFGVVASGAFEPNVNSIPPGLNLASRTSSALGTSTSSVASRRRSGGVNASYVVSDSGGTLTLGTAYHVSSHGVREFQEQQHDHPPPIRRESSSTTDTLTSAYSLELPASSSSAVSCRHIAELDFDNGVQIGRGSSGKVYNVLHVPSGIRVCVKQMLIDDSRRRAEVKRELDTLHKAPSRYIVDFYGAFFHEDLGVILLVLELMEGSLLEIMRRKGRLTEIEAKAFAFQVVNGLYTLHNELKLIHRDIKPANLLYHRSGQVKITDFGVSTGQQSHDPTSVQTFVGSVLYMSPERLEAHSYGFESDIWSLGIALCEALTGCHPYQDEFGSDAMPLTFWGLLQRVMAADPERHRSPLRASIRKQRVGKAATAAGRQPSSQLGLLEESDVSNEVDDFVRQCLTFDRSKRATAETLLKHPWFHGFTIKDSEETLRRIADDVAAMRAMQLSSSSGIVPITESNRPPASHPVSDVASSAQLFQFNCPTTASFGGKQHPHRAVSSQQSSPLQESGSPTQQGAQDSQRLGRSEEGTSPLVSTKLLTPISLTPDETRKRSDFLLNDLLQSVKKSPM